MESAARRLEAAVSLARPGRYDAAREVGDVNDALHDLPQGLSDAALARVSLALIASPGVLRRLRLRAIEAGLSRGVRRDVTRVGAPSPWAAVALLASAAAVPAAPLSAVARTLLGPLGATFPPVPNGIDAMAVAAMCDVPALGRAATWLGLQQLPAEHVVMGTWVRQAASHGEAPAIPVSRAASEWMSEVGFRGFRRSIARGAGRRAAAGESPSMPAWLAPWAGPGRPGHAAMCIEWLVSLVRFRSLAQRPEIPESDRARLVASVRVAARAGDEEESGAGDFERWLDSAFDDR